MSKFTHWCKNFEWSLKRLLVYVGGASCTIAFLKSAYMKGVLDWKVYPAYALALIMLYMPQLAITALKIYKGISEEKNSTDGDS